MRDGREFEGELNCWSRGLENERDFEMILGLFISRLSKRCVLMKCFTFFFFKQLFRPISD